jgi:hypothetical protein
MGGDGAYYVTDYTGLFSAVTGKNTSALDVIGKYMSQKQEGRNAYKQTGLGWTIRCNYEGVFVYSITLLYKQRGRQVRENCDVTRLGVGQSGIRTPAEAKDFPFLQNVQTGSGAHPASYSMSTWGSCSGCEAEGHEAAHSPPSRAEVKNKWSYTCTPHTCLHSVHEDNCTFYLYAMTTMEINVFYIQVIQMK